MTVVNKVIAALKSLWKREPVLVATGLPLLVTAGVVTADQANAVAGGAAAVVQVVAAFLARRVVTPPSAVPVVPQA